MRCLSRPALGRANAFPPSNKSFTFAFEHRKNIARIALSPQRTLLLSVDDDGRAILTNYVRRSVLHHFNFKAKVHALEFSPDGMHFAVSVGKKIEVWRTPEYIDEREFAPFVKHREYTGHSDAVTHITWSSDSRFFLTAAKDLTARIWSLNPAEGFVPTTLSSHREAVVGAWFSKDQETVCWHLVNVVGSALTSADIHVQQGWCTM